MARNLSDFHVATVQRAWREYERKDLARSQRRDYGKKPLNFVSDCLLDAEAKKQLVYKK